jgi:lipopolysaccharide biosynthesis protein
LFSTTNWLQNNKVAVCLYLYHTDLWPEFKKLLLPLSKYIKLYIGLSKDNDPIEDFDDFDYCLSFHENYGADVAPFLHQLQLVSEPLFIKLHSKKSSWGFKYHINWRDMLLDDLISSKKIFYSNIRSLAINHNSAVLCNQVFLMDNREFLNSAKIAELCDYLEMDYDKIKNGKFVGGNMFMGKTSVYKKYIIPALTKIDRLLYNEKGKIQDTIDGTYSHSMERIFGYIINYNNLEFCHPKRKIIKVLNPAAPNKRHFRLIKMYNNYCYLLEDPNVYGFISDENSETCIITWYHLNNQQNTSAKYKMINKHTIYREQS